MSQLYPMNYHGKSVGGFWEKPASSSKGESILSSQDNIQRQYCVGVEAGAAAAILQPCRQKPEDKSQLDDKVRMSRALCP